MPVYFLWICHDRICVYSHFRAVKQQRNRSVIYGMYLHVGSEFAVFHCKTSGAAGLHKFFVQGNRLLRFGRVGKAGTAFLQVSIEGELGNHQKGAAHLVQAQVHLSVFIFKNAAVTDFFRHLVRYGFP